MKIVIKLPKTEELNNYFVKRNINITQAVIG